jgi:hypothetical protein
MDVEQILIDAKLKMPHEAVRDRINLEVCNFVDK